MKTTARAAVALMVLASAGLAHAGQTGAGPGGTGSLAMGTVITPEALAAALFGTSEPGAVGSVRLSAEQATQISSYLAQQPGASTVGSTVSAEGAFPDGSRFRLAVDSATATLTFTRL